MPHHQIKFLLYEKVANCPTKYLFKKLTLSENQYY